MARVSRRINNTILLNENIYRAGVYVRLSNERTESWRNKSQSIESQIFYCKEYAKKFGITVFKIYKDYEFSGTNFERPAYKEMIEDIKNYKINCIIVRDLSRLGREYLEMGLLIEKVFPFLGVRFISIDDNLDSKNGINDKKAFEISIKNIINDMYAKDISSKVKSSKHTKAKNGYFIGSNPPYGYKILKTKEGRKLIIDENVKFIVKKIFDMAIKGNSTYFIAKYLNTNKYSNPTRYYKTGDIYRNNEEHQWSASKVKAILKNEVYIGNLIQGVYQQDLTKGKKRYKADISELIIFENAHEGIISKEEFETIKSNKGSNLIKKKFLNLPSESIFKVIVYEKETNKLLNIHRKIYRNNSNKFKFIFINNIYPEKIESKTKIYFDEKFLINHILNILNEFISNIKDRDLFIKKINYKFYYLRKTIKANLNKLNKNLIETKESIRNKYIQYTNNGIKLEEYINFKNLQKNRLKNIENEITLNNIKNNNILKYHQTLLEFLRIILKDNTELILNKELLSLFIEKILVNRDKTIELKFKINFEKLIQIQ